MFKTPKTGTVTLCLRRFFWLQWKFFSSSPLHPALSLMGTENFSSPHKKFKGKTLTMCMVELEGLHRIVKIHLFTVSPKTVSQFELHIFTWGASKRYRFLKVEKVINSSASSLFSILEIRYQLP